VLEAPGQQKGDEHLRRCRWGRSLRPSKGSVARAAAAALALVTATAVAPIDNRAGAASSPPFEVVGSIPMPNTSNHVIVGTDLVHRRLYTTHIQGPNAILGTYDLDTPVPSLLSQRPIAPYAEVDSSTYHVVIEPVRRRIYMLTGNQAGASAIMAVGAEGNPMATERWELSTILPGFFAGGMTYSAEDDRIYLVGEMSESMYVTTSTYTFNNKVAGGVGAVAAIDPDDGALLWVRPVPECRFPLYTLFTGSLIARSSPALPTPSLFFPCSPGSTLLGTNLPYQPGVAALSISPAATQVDAERFDVRFYPISGNFFNGADTGIAGYDYGSDRLFLQSLSTKTPGAWVLDAHLDTWVGAITAPTPRDAWLGINQKTGHYYMGGRSGGDDQSASFLLVAEGRTPRPQNGINAGPEHAPIRSIVTDPETDRLFVWPYNTRPITVLKDRTPVARPPSALDYDAQTDDIADTPDAFVAFTGDAGGFGSRVTAIGDTASLNGTAGRDEATPTATRSVTFARGPSTNVQPAGAASAAQAATLDTTTDQALRDNPQLPRWPYATKTCLDGGDGVKTEPEQTATSYASVTCRLATFEAASEARHAGGTAPGITVGNANYRSTVNRTVKDGMVTVAESSSAGIRIDLPGAATLEIAKASAKAVTTAHGRKGTATATWERAIEGVVAKDGTGKVVFEAPGCNTKLVHNGKEVVQSGSTEGCDQLAEGVRKALQVNVRLRFPLPSVEATAKGAFASVGQSVADHAGETTVNNQGNIYAGDSATRRTVPAIQIDVYHDSIERSRDIVQLAGVEATSVFTVNRSLDDDPCATGGCIAGGSDEFAPSDFAADAPGTGGFGSSVDTTGDLGREPIDGGEVAPGSSAVLIGGGRVLPSGGAVTRELVGFLLTRRSLGQGSLMAAFLLVAGMALGTVVRRRRLLDLLSSH
jgi:hypothetical protein